MHESFVVLLEITYIHTCCDQLKHVNHKCKIKPQDFIVILAMYTYTYVYIYINVILSPLHTCCGQLKHGVHTNVHVHGIYICTCMEPQKTRKKTICYKDESAQREQNRCRQTCSFAPDIATKQPRLRNMWTGMYCTKITLDIERSSQQRHKQHTYRKHRSNKTSAAQRN